MIQRVHCHRARAHRPHRRVCPPHALSESFVVVFVVGHLLKKPHRCETATPPRSWMARHRVIFTLVVVDPSLGPRFTLLIDT